MRVDQCFVCFEDTDSKPVSFCSCSDLLAHDTCMVRIIEEVPSHASGVCPICKTHYKRIKQRTKYTCVLPEGVKMYSKVIMLSYTLSGVSCMLFMNIHNAHETINRFLLALLSLFVCILLFLLPFAAMYYLHAVRGIEFNFLRRHTVVSITDSTARYMEAV